MLSRTTSDTLMRLINVQYTLFNLKILVILYEKNSRYINAFNKYTIYIILFEKCVMLSGKTCDTLMRLINKRYILFYLKNL
jgi:hypothetical protein